MSEQIVEYQVVSGPVTDLVKKVNTMLADGWELWGSYQDAGADGRNALQGQQAMVKRKRPPQHLTPR